MFEPRPTYLQVYNRYMGTCMRYIDEQVRRDVAALRRCGVRTRLASLTHLECAIRTQHRFERVEVETVRTVKRALRLASLERNLRLRRLQGRILQHLWRPTGRLAHSERASALRMLQ